MRRYLLATSLVAAHPAVADPLSIRALRDGEDEPALVMDGDLLLDLTSVGAVEKRERASYRLGPLRLDGMTKTWQVDDRTPSEPPIDLRGRGWTVGGTARLVLGRGWTLEGGLTVNRLDSAYGSGTYRDVGLALRKVFRLSAKRSAWLGVGIHRRSWDGKAPENEANATVMGIQGGVTF